MKFSLSEFSLNPNFFSRQATADFDKRGSQVPVALQGVFPDKGVGIMVLVEILETGSLVLLPLHRVTLHKVTLQKNFPVIGV